jgi:hypothetical protein
LIQLVHDAKARSTGGDIHEILALTHAYESYLDKIDTGFPEWTPHARWAEKVLNFYIGNPQKTIHAALKKTGKGPPSPRARWIREERRKRK